METLFIQEKAEKEKLTKKKNYGKEKTQNKKAEIQIYHNKFKGIAFIY